MTPTPTYIMPAGTRYAVCTQGRVMAYCDTYFKAWMLREASKKRVEVR